MNGDGQSDDRGDVLGTEDVACGATSRIRIEVPEESDGVEFDVSTRETSRRALFDAVIVDPVDDAH